MNEAEETVVQENQDKGISILIADDHPLFRKAVRSTLEKYSDFTAIYEAGNGEEAVEQAIELVPDVVIMDISMPVMNGLEATRQIKAQCPSISVLVLTVHNDIEHILGILEAGAVGYLTKSTSADEVVTTVRSIIAGETVIATDIFKQVLKHTLRYSIKPQAAREDVILTARELEVLKLAAKGLSNKDISLQLDLSLRTVKGYMVEIFSKLNAKSRTEAVIIGLRQGLVGSEDIE